MSGTLRTKLRRDVARQWPQFVAVIVTILLGVALFAASYDAYRNLEASYQGLFEDQAFADLFVTGGDVGAFAATARDDPAVAAVATRVEADLPLRIGPDKLRGRVVGLTGDVGAGGRAGCAASPSAQPTAPGATTCTQSAGGVVNEVGLLRGARPAGPGEVLVEQHAADHFGLGAGDTIEALGPDGWHTLTVSGVAVSGEYLWPARSRNEIITLPDDFAVVFAPPDTARTVAGHDANQALVRYGQDADGSAADQRLRAAALGTGATQVLTRDDQPSNSVLREDLNGFSQMSVAFPLLFLGAAAMATYVLLTRRVRSERSIIGMLLASGVRRRDVLTHYIGYGVAAGAIGGAVGVAAGVGSARTLTRFYVGFIDLPVDRSVIVFRPETVLIGLAFGLVTGFVAALAPALAASRTPPAEAMNPIVPATGGRYSLLERLIPPLQRLPARWRMVLRGIGRNRRRTTYTILGVVLSLLLVLVSWSMIDTMNALLSVQFDQVQLQDARVDFTAPVQQERLAELRAVEGVQRVEPAVTLPVALRTGDASFGTAMIALPRDTQVHGFRLTDGSTTHLPDQGVLVGVGARTQLDVGVGDPVTVEVQAPGLQAQVPTTIAGFLDEPLGTFVYTSLDRLGAVAGGDLPLTSAYLVFDEGADRDAIRRAVTDLGFVAAYEDAHAVQQLFDDFTGLFYGFIGGMLVLGGLMAFAMIFTTMSVNVIERSREVATLRASGVRLRTISQLISSENLIVTLLGIVPGLVVGVLGARAMLQTYSSDQFQLDLVVRPVTLLASALAIVAVAALSQWPSLRAVRRLDIASVVRERGA